MPDYYDWPQSDEEAKRRAADFKSKDPFASIPMALLSSAEIEDYVRVTGMVYPFDTKNLKSASYEAHIGGRFIQWNELGEKTDKTVKPGDPIVLPPNSISFVQVEPTFLLPNYIALRFNLRITHVHRGLLLGTGPLVDPGFEGNLLIPVHNLTATPYHINTKDALIWIEFTKTTFGFEPIEDNAHHPRIFRGFGKEKVWLTPDDYLRKASGNEPIRSSIPDAIQDAEKSAATAEKSAATAARLTRNIGLGGGLAVAIALVGVAIGGYEVVTSTLGLISETSNNLARIESNLVEVSSDIAGLRAKLLASGGANDERDDKIGMLREAADSLEAAINRISEQTTEMKSKIDELESGGMAKQGAQE